MTKQSSLLQGGIISTALRISICLALLRFCNARNSFDDLVLSTQTLNPVATGFIITGNTAGDYFGGSVSTAGDINNDGYDDIIVGVPKKNSNQGAAYVIYGGEESSFLNFDLSTTTLNPSMTGFMITGNAVGDYFGGTVSTAGDINNDGYDDIIIGAFTSNSGQGAVYVIYGGEKSSTSNVILSSTTLIPASTGFKITGNAANNYFGASVNKAGDINNDGYGDIIVGAPLKGVQGAAYVIYGRAKSTMSNIALSSTTLDPTLTGFMITGNAAGDYFGGSVSPAGDINHDGYDDIIVGAEGKNSYQGAAYVIYGGEKSSMFNIDLSSTILSPASTGFTITGNAVAEYFGNSVSKAGDINNDGYDDIVIGAGNKYSFQGAAYVIYGGDKSTRSNIVLSSTTLDPPTTGFMITGNAGGDNFGAPVSNAGDINNDGYDDIIVGAPFKNSQQGAAYVIYASCSANCKQCSSESLCTQCKNSFLLYQSECFASCPDATFANTVTTCQDCSTHCKHCSSTSVCTECQNSYILYQSKCLDSCPDGMFLSSTTSTCEDCISPCKRCTSLTACIECISPLTLYTSGCVPSCPTSMFNSNNVCKDCPPNCYSCTSQDSCQVCYQAYTLSNSNSLCILAGAQEKASQVIASATQGIGSFVCVGSAIFPLSALVSKIVQNTRYLNLSVTSELSQVYQTWQTDLISWDVPNLMSDLDHFETSPTLFAQYDLGSPFLVNFWPTLINVGIGFGTFFTCILIQKIFEHEKYEGWASSLIRKLVAGSFNFALVQAYACLDDVLFYLVLDAKTNLFNSFFSWTSMICAVNFLALGCLQVFFNFWTVYKYQSIKNQRNSIEAFNERNKYWELFYSDFNDDDIWSQSFFAIVIIRSVLSSLSIAILYDYPLLQTSYLIMMDIAIISFLCLKNPFNTLRGKLAQYYYEIITLLVHLCAFILALQDSFDKSSETVRVIMSTGILYLNTALISGAIGFMFIEIYETVRLKKKTPKRQSVPEDIQETQNLTQSADRLQSSEAQVQKRQGSINQEETQSIERPYLFAQNRQNLAHSDFANRESNFNTESSRELDIYPSSSQNHSRPMMIRNQLGIRKKRQQRNGPIFPSYAINNEQFSNN